MQFKNPFRYLQVKYKKPARLLPRTGIMKTKAMHGNLLKFPVMPRDFNRFYQLVPFAFIYNGIGNTSGN